VGPSAGLDRCGKSRPHRDSIPDLPARRSVTIPTELPGPHVTPNSSTNITITATSNAELVLLTFWRRNYFFKF